MKTHFYKKIVSFLFIFSLFFWYIETYALTTLTPVLNTNLQLTQDLEIYNPKIITTSNIWSFLVNNIATLNKETLYLTWITSINAWKVLKTWNIDSSFNKNFVIKPIWTDYDFLVMKLDRKGLNEALEKTSLAKNTYEQYKTVVWWIWELEVQNPKLEMMPDRLVLTSNIKIKFKTKKELENIKKYYQLNNATIFKSLQTKQELVNSKDIFENVSWLEKANSFKYLYEACLKDTTCKTILASKLWISSTIIQTRFYKTSDNQLIEDVFFDESEYSVIEQEEKIEISLIPVNPLWSKTFYNNLIISPEAVRISSVDINNIFINIDKISKISKKVAQASQEASNISDTLKNICKSYTSTIEKTACEKLASEYLNPKNKTYEKILINGITLWNEYKYSFKARRKKWSVVIYDIDVGVDFGFGFGIRIPIKAKIDINKSIIQAWVNTSAKKFNASIQVQTINATAQQYTDAWIVPSQVFDWKEFVFKVYANLHWKLVLVNNTIFNQTYDLMALLWELTWVEWLDSIDESKDFIPPFAWINTIKLLEKEFWIQVYKKEFWMWGWTLFADLSFQAYIDWYIKAFCKTINSSSSYCNKNLEFRSVSPKILEFEGNINTQELKQDLLWQYNDYGLILNDFQYIPQLVSFIKSRARLHYRYDISIYSNSDDISTPWYEIFKYTIDLPALWAHTWYWVDWQYILTEEQKQLKATDNKFYHNLKEIFYTGLVLVIPEFEWLKDKFFVIRPSIINPWNWAIIDPETNEEIIEPEDSWNISEEVIREEEVEWTPSDNVIDDGDSVSSYNESDTVDDIEDINLEIVIANTLASKWIIIDHSDNTELYNLKQNVLRQEIANIARKLAWLEKSTKCKNIFSDLSIAKPNSWACLSIEPLVEKNILARNTNFKPEANITKTEALKMIIKSIGLDYNYDDSISKDWQEQVVDYSVNKGLIVWFTDYNTFATRWWIFKIADKALSLK